MIHRIRCHTCQDSHSTVAQVRECFAEAEYDRQEAEAVYRIERGYERHLEDRGYNAARAQDEHEARMGVIPFDEAYAAAMA